jgi:hypothetical protein
LFNRVTAGGADIEIVQQALTVVAAALRKAGFLQMKK